MGSGIFLLKRVSKSSSVWQCHSSTLPNKRDGISVRAFLTPGMCTGVRGQVCLIFRQRASARTSQAAICDFLEAILLTQLTVGKLSPNKVMCLCARFGAVPSRQSHNRNRPAIS